MLRLSNLLLRQLLEKESALKLLVKKYVSSRLIEKGHVKTAFKTEYEKLERLNLPNKELEEARNALRVKEANLLRDIDLRLDRVQK